MHVASRKSVKVVSQQLQHSGLDLLCLLATRQKIAEAADRISLAGTWRFQLDPNDAGFAENWFKRALRDELKLPGALQNQGVGCPVDAKTEWTGVPNVETWLQGTQYAKYRQPGNI